jgi:hypothetical protein
MITTSKQISLAAAGTLVGLVLLAAPAFAYSDAVINACTDDYLAHCSAYDENSAQGERCMRAVGGKLSQSCVNALVASGEVSKGEVKRRTKR